MLVHNRILKLSRKKATVLFSGKGLLPFSKVSLEEKTMAQGLGNKVGVLYQARMKGDKYPCQ